MDWGEQPDWVSEAHIDQQTINGRYHQKKTDRGIQNTLCDSQAFNNR